MSQQELAHTFIVGTTNLDPNVALHLTFIIENVPFSKYVSSEFGGGQSEIPEPTTLALLDLGLFGMAVARRCIF